MTDTKWRDRIAMLLAKAESTDSPQEAAALTAKAQELMLKHSIDEAMLAGVGEQEAALIEVEEFQLHYASAYSNRIIKFLVFPVVQGMGTVRMFTVAKSRKSFWLVGRRSDIDLNMLLIQSLIQQGIVQMRAWANNDPRVKAMPRQEQRTARGQFLITFGLTVGRRVKELYEVVTARTTGSELVLASRLSDVDQFVNSNFSIKQAGASRMNGSHLGQEEGLRAGLKANIGGGRRAVDGS